VSVSIETLLTIARQGIPFTAADGQAFVRLAVPSGGFCVLPVRSPAYRNWFFSRFFSRYDTLPSAGTYNLLLNHLEAQANDNPDNQRLSTFHRVGAGGDGPVPDRILLDLANPGREIVEISREGWQVNARASALLESSRSSRPLPVPVQDPDTEPSAPLQLLRSLLNLSSRADWLRCLSWLLAALRPPVGPFPILILRGPSASGKTFAARVFRALIDPSSAPLSPTPATSRDVLALAHQNWILAFDHISGLSPNLTDTLCRLTSGLGIAVRESSGVTSEPLLQYLKRPVLLTVTDRWRCPDDLAERALTVTCASLSPDRRRPETELFAAFHQARPAILAALCSAVSTALSRLPDIHTSGSRCPDALFWAMAAAPSLDCTAEELQQAFAPPRRFHPSVEAVRALLDSRPHWSGTAAQLFELVKPAVSCRTPKGISQQLRSRPADLAAAGIQLKFRRTSGGIRIIELGVASGDASNEKCPSDASP
jgi:hypothetical protein